MMTCGAQSKPGLAGACSSLEHHQTKAGVPTFADGTDSLRPNLTLFLSFPVASQAFIFSYCHTIVS